MSLASKTVKIGLFLASITLITYVVIVAGLYFYLVPKLPSVDTLKDIRMQEPLRVYSADHKLMAEFGEKRREPISFDKVPNLMIQALLASEDDRFFEHHGVDYAGLIRAAIELVATGQKRQGGSTITMQVARNFFLSSEKTYTRKINEILLSYKIENELSKQEILALYFNKIFLGHRAYGIGAAAKVYYGRELKDLSLGQIAVIAGLPKAPSQDNPVTNPPAALHRRHYVLSRMLKLGSINEEQYRIADAEPITASLHSPEIALNAPYAAEMVRDYMVQKYGENAYTEGFNVYTTIQAKLQDAAVLAIEVGLHEYDRRHGYRGTLGHINLDQQLEKTQWDQSLTNYNAFGNLQPAIVVQVHEKSLQAYAKNQTLIEIPWEGISWARKQLSENSRGSSPSQVSDLLKRGDIIYMYPDTELGWRLAQMPEAESAFVCLNPNNGAIQAIAGGYNFFKSNFNRAVQGERQPGSNFKPFIYSAALNKGFTPASIILDAPIVYDDPSLEKSWRPQNYSGKYNGPMRLREGLVESRNLVSIRLLSQIGIPYALDYLHAFGFDDKATPQSLTLALGTGLVTPLKLATAYATFANGGYRVENYLVDRIEDSTHKVVYQHNPAPTNRIITAENAYLMTSIMQDVIKRGTARKALALKRADIAGKTGTTNGERDAWFSGFNADLIATAWFGFDDMRPLGDKETGGKAALPIWMKFMEIALADKPEHAMAQPPGIVAMRINPDTGLLTDTDSPGALFEIFDVNHLPDQQQMETIQSEQGEKIERPEELF